MPDYQYVAWFRDATLEPDDPDYEWPACIIVSAANGHAAQTWGDSLASDYSGRAGCEFLRSYLDPNRWENGQVPRIVDGEAASDEIIGW